MARSLADLVEAQVASGKTKLPVFSGTAAKLQELLRDPPSTSKPILELLQSDPVLVSGVLRLANSSFYGGLREAATIRDALLRLGMDPVVRIALAVSQQQAYRVRTPDLQPVVAALWRHSHATALGARWLAGKIGRPQLGGEAFLAGMVHDIGKLLVLRVIDDLRAARADFRPAPNLVDEMLTSLHARHGAALAREWHLPASYVRVIEHHHDPEPADDDTLLLIVRLVDLAANGLGFGIGPKVAVQAAATHEAQVLRLTDVALAELEIFLEDSMAAAKAAGV